MLTMKKLDKILKNIKSPYGTFRTGDDCAALWLQFVVVAPDAAPAPGFKAPLVPQHGRKWRVSLHSTDREVVGTALMAVLAAVEHEVRETFTFEGAAIFHPHVPLEALFTAAEEEADARLKRNH